MRYKTTDLIIFALFGAIIYSFNQAACPFLNILTGLPAGCGVVGLVFEPFLALLGALIIRKPFSFASILLVLSALLVLIPATFVSIVPPTITAVGIVLSAILTEPFIRRYSMKWNIVSGIFYLLIQVPLTLVFLKILGLPLPLETALFSLPVLLIIGATSGFLASFVYNRIKNKTFIRRLQK